MATLQFQQASVELTYLVGQDENGDSVYKKSALRHVRETATVNELHAVVQAIASLSGYPLMEAVKTQKQFIL